jgi:hypothetical protein
VWRAKIVLATADGHGTNEIVRRIRPVTSGSKKWLFEGSDASGG